MRKLIIALFFVVSVSSSVYTNDTAGYVLPTGGVVFEKQNGIKMQTEALYIRPGQIEVNYLFENTTDKDITTPYQPYRMSTESMRKHNINLTLNCG